jgi:hypothetical protein
MKLDADIESLDLDPIGYKLCLDEGWPLAQIDQAISDYRVFLQAIRLGVGPLVPTKRTDTVWHHHILDTEKYHGDCHQIFGRYVHHFPYSGLLDEVDAENQKRRFSRSLAVYEAISPAHKESSDE